MANVCEHGDHPAPEGKRFCSRECADCELGTKDCQWCKWEANPPDLGIALSVHAPWAWALMYGGKDVENRSARFPRNRGGKQIRGRVWIHASMWPGPKRLTHFTPSMNEFLTELSEVEGRFYCISNAPKNVRLEGLFERVIAMRGHIVGSVEVYGYATPESPPDSVWYIPGSLGILVRDPRPLATPVRAKGSLGWWGVPDDVLAEVRRVT